MNLDAHLVPGEWLWASLIVFALLLWRLGRAPLAALGEPRRLNVFLGAVVVLSLLWSMKAGVQPGLNLHFLGAMAMVLAFGAPLALYGLALVLAVVTINGDVPWQAFGLNALLMAALPVAVARALYRGVERHLPNHFFVYIFLNAFFGAALTVMLSGVAGACVLWLAGAYGFEHLVGEYLPYFLLLGFSEAWLTGFALTLMVVYRPQWVSTFDDTRYLLDK